MCAFKHHSGENQDISGDKLKTPGIYHFIVQVMDEMPTIKGGPKAGQLIDNAAFRPELVCIGGTVEGARNKVHEELFFNTGPNDTDEQRDRNVLKFDRFFLATSLMKPEDKDKDLEIDLQQAVGRQLVMKLELKNDGKNLTCWQDIYHVDDPAIAHALKNEDSQKALKLIKPELRWIGGKEKPAPPAPKPVAPKVNAADI